MKMKNVFLATSTSLIVFLLAACNVPLPQFTPPPTLTPIPTATPTPIPTATALPSTGIRYHFITNKLLIPTTREQAQSFALDIDGDPQQHPDNLFGNLLTLLISTSPTLKLQSTVDQEISAGHIVALHVVQANDPLNAAIASWTIFQGQKTSSAPNFDGADKFTLDPAAPANSQMTGSIKNGHFSGGPGSARVQMAILGSLVEVNLIGVRIEADVSEKGCADGKLGGGVTVKDFHTQFLPALADGLNQVIQTDKTAANVLLQAFDADQNGAISPGEIENNFLLKLALSPDLDLLDASGKFNPRQDGVNDSLSVGLGFTCVPATFTAPGD
jgi:hypothetical protein